MADLAPVATVLPVSANIENGVIFSEGLRMIILIFSAGVTATLTVSDLQGILVV
jgi:hypothetical protein